MEALIKRAVSILSFLSPEETAETLVASGVSKELAFLAVMAAGMLLKDSE